MPIGNLSNRTILVVDDSPDNLSFMAQSLSTDYQVKVANSGLVALNILNKFAIDLVLLDVMMPEMDGYQVITEMKATKSFQDIPVIFLTAKCTPEDEKKGFELGAADYINKPVSVPILEARVRTHLQNKVSRDFLSDQNELLEMMVKDRTLELEEVKDSIVIAMASLAETRDNETGNHILRTQYYVKVLAEQLATKEKYSKLLTPETVKTYYKAAPLHDIGKVGIPDGILLKPGKLTSEEFTIMQEHPTLGLAALIKAEEHSSNPNAIIDTAKEIAYCHHEKWDGTGYPQKLCGEQIPLSARLMAVADVYDALISKRIYKDAMPHDKAKEIILEGREQHFDPDVVDAFIACEKLFIEIARRYSD
ncbi:response regulator [Vibrio nigripulchritudo]|uniref:response regulator n=1 Tax=Vibrio nigripulchritudo TaxID=28173 RepID=UPI00190BB0F8|nr:two-component system response regulator [Vibrio nigripulchritudo]BCL73562.1 response regulator [Vibrio nigripulchritudo]BDU34930.1 response regulator [Vibrio nigripulchritudo]